MFKKTPRSIKKFIRLEKSYIRKKFFDYAKQQEAINELYNKVFKKEPENKKESEVTKKIEPVKNNLKKEKKPGLKKKNKK